jgi:hypothetical protein
MGTLVVTKLNNYVRNLESNHLTVQMCSESMHESLEDSDIIFTPAIIMVR